jgi:hypothetical protein
MHLCISELSAPPHLGLPLALFLVNEVCLKADTPVRCRAATAPPAPPAVLVVMEQPLMAMLEQESQKRKPPWS